MKSQITNGEITVKVGDSVLNYDEGTGSTQIGTTESGHTEQQTITTENLGWRILGIGENGGLELISDNPTTATVTLSGETGYLNAEDVLNTVCNELYGNGEYAERARSLNVEDINKLANYNPKTESTTYGNLYKYRFSTEAGYMQYSKSTDNGQTWSNWLNITNVDYQIFRMPGLTETISAENPKESEEIENTYYAYSISSEITDTNIANMITNGTGDSNVTQWLASRALHFLIDFSYFSVRLVDIGNMNHVRLYVSNDNSYSFSCAVRPVVSLESNIQLEGNLENGWTII